MLTDFVENFWFKRWYAYRTSYIELFSTEHILIMWKCKSLIEKINKVSKQWKFIEKYKLTKLGFWPPLYNNPKYHKFIKIRKFEIVL